MISANHASLGEQGHNGKAQAPDRMGESKDCRQKKEKALNTNGGTRTLETSGFDWGALEW